MSEKLKIKISIADRVYPLTVEPSQEEGLRSASKKIDAMIKQFEQSYAVRDKQDVLAMCALQFASQVEQKQIEKSEDHEESLNRLKKFKRPRRSLLQQSLQLINQTWLLLLQINLELKFNVLRRLCAIRSWTAT